MLTPRAFFYKFGPKPQMLLSLRKIANIILEEFEAATCDVSERCFLLHIFTFLCFTSRSVEQNSLRV